MSRKTILAGLAALAAACGGSGTERTTKSFSYGSGTVTSASSLTAASDVSNGVAASAQFTAAPDGDMAASLVTLPDSLDAALGSASFALRQGLTAESPAERAVTAATARLVGTPTATVTSGCATVTATSVTFKACSVDAADGTGSLKVTLDGSVSKIGTDEVKWDLTATASGTMTVDGATGPETTTVSGSIHYFGDLTGTATSLDGFAESDKSISISAPNLSGSAKITNSIDFGKVTVDGTGCVASGSVELKRIGSVSAVSGARSASGSVDAALKLTWQGCGTVLVQHSI